MTLQMFLRPVHRGRAHPRPPQLAIAVAVHALVLAACLGSGCSAAGASAAIERDGDGNLLAYSEPGKAVMLNGVDVLGTLAMMQDAIAAQANQMEAAAAVAKARDKAIADLALGLAKAGTSADLDQLKLTVKEVIDDLSVLSEATTGTLCDEYPALAGGTVHGHGLGKGAVRVLECNDGLTLSQSQGTVVCKATAAGGGAWSDATAARCAATTTTTLTTTTTVTTTTKKAEFGMVLDTSFAKMSNACAALPSCSGWTGTNFYPKNTKSGDGYDWNARMGKGKLCSSQCTGFRVLGGTDCVAKGTTLETTLKNLAPRHGVMVVTLDLMVIDSFDSNEVLHILVDHKLVGTLKSDPKTADPGAWTNNNDKNSCGSVNRREKHVAHRAQFRHTGTTAHIQVSSTLNGYPLDESFGIQRIRVSVHQG